MKNRFLAGGIGMLLLGGVAFLYGFDTAKTATGSISVKTTFNGTPMSGVLVGVATSAENRENSEYIHEEETDAHGIIKFANISAGTYYLDADKSTDDGDSYYAEATVTVAEGLAEVTIELEAE